MDQQEELKRLRELVAKLQNENQNLCVQNENLTQAVLHAQKKVFGRSSESSAHIKGQLALFAEEQLVEELAAQQEKLTVQPHQRKPRQPGVRAEMLANLPTEVIRYETEAESGCPVCQGELMKVGSKVVRSEVVYKPAVLKIVRQTMANWVIRICEEWLSPICERIHKQLLKSEVLHCDETRIQCNKEEGKKAASQSFMWVMCSGQDEKHQGVIFRYTRRAWLFADGPKGAEASGTAYNNRVYAGDEFYPQIVRKELWNKAQGKRQLRAMALGRDKNYFAKDKLDISPFRGKIICSVCGSEYRR